MKTPRTKLDNECCVQFWADILFHKDELPLPSFKQDPNPEIRVTLFFEAHQKRHDDFAVQKRTVILEDH